MSAAFALAVQLLAADSDQAWSRTDTRGAFTLYTRPAGSAGFSEYRVEVVTDVAVDLLCEAVFEWGTKGTDYPGVTSRKLLKDEPDERITFDSLRMPVVTDREYVMKVSRARPADGSCRLRFTSTDELAPKKADGVVRIELLRGGWDFERQGEKTKLTYTLFAEPGGAIPAFLVGGTQQQNAFTTVAMALQKARALEPVKKAEPKEPAAK